jgi:hypothetical protein
MNQLDLCRFDGAVASRGPFVHRKVLESPVFGQRLLPSRYGEYGRERLPTRAARTTPESMAHDIVLGRRPWEQVQDS